MAIKITRFEVIPTKNGLSCPIIEEETITKCSNCGYEFNHLEHYVLCKNQYRDNIKHMFNSEGLLK